MLNDKSYRHIVTQPAILENRRICSYDYYVFLSGTNALTVSPTMQVIIVPIKTK